MTYHAAYEPMRAIRTHDYCLVKRFYDESWILANIDDSPAKDAWADLVMERSRNAEVSLFHLKSDPEQLNNVANDPVFRSMRDSLELRLMQWMADTNDPLLLGHVARPDKSRGES
ncbi:MAG: hypothetical protein LR015_00785 [Verrucomicrobia bacterium]|nr:hypothetical protein [Verrucomicrobiota bacterium]